VIESQSGAVWRALLLGKKQALSLLHRSLIFSKRLLLHRNDPRDAVAINRDLKVNCHGAVDPFTAARVLDVVIVLEAGGVIAVGRLLAQANVAADGGAARGPAGIVRFDIAPDRVDRFPAFFKQIDVRRIERYGEIDVVRFVAGNEVVHEIVDPHLPGPVVSWRRLFLIWRGRAR